MTQKERDRPVALKKAKKKLITQREAAAELGVSDRQVRQLLRNLKVRGDFIGPLVCCTMQTRAWICALVRASTPDAAAQCGIKKFFPIVGRIKFHARRVIASYVMKVGIDSYCSIGFSAKFILKRSVQNGG